MFGLITKKNLRKLFGELNTNVDEAVGRDDFNFRRGIASTVDCICREFKITCPAPGYKDNGGT